VERPKTANVLLIQELKEEVDEQYLPAPTLQALDLNHLSEERQARVTKLCHSEVFKENPGKTDIVEHDIVLKDAASVRQMS